MSNDAPSWLQAPASSAPPPQPAAAPGPASQPASGGFASGEASQQSFGGQSNGGFGRGGGVDSIDGLSTAYDWKTAFWVQHVLRFFFIGCSIFLASVAALSMANVQDADGDKQAEIIFVSIYLILFSGIMFSFEITRYFPNDTLEAIFLRNFGVLYGPAGRGLTYAFFGVLALGNVEVGGQTEQLAISATAITCGFGFIQVCALLGSPSRAAT
uniref:Uncharacterized protein n=1 Tax=Pinguiococcus pyrenoidosus TaxID=172671 RepID=A0A7R9YBB3_9STRA